MEGIIGETSFNRVFDRRIRILGDLATRLAKLACIRFGEEGMGEFGAVTKVTTGDAIGMLGVGSDGEGDVGGLSVGGGVLGIGLEGAPGCGAGVGVGVGSGAGAGGV